MAGMIDLSQLFGGDLGWLGSAAAMAGASDAADTLAHRMRQQSPNVPPPEGTRKGNRADLVSPNERVSQAFGSLTPDAVEGAPATAPADVPLPQPRPQMAPPVNVVPSSGTGAVAGPPGAPAAAPTAAPASFLDRLGNGINNNSGLLLALGSGFAGAPSLGEGMRRGFAGAAPFADQGKTEQALINAGIPPANARLMAQSPEAFKAMAPKYFGEDLKVVPFGSTAIRARGPQQGQQVYTNNSSDMLLDDKTLDAMAHQAMAGDTTVFQNLGRGAQGAQNIVRLRERIAQLNGEAGQTGTDQAMRNAEFFGVKSGQRTLGTKQANIELAGNEFKSILPIVSAASDAVNRTQYPDLNKIIQAFEEKTGDPNVVKFGSGVNTLVNLYARAISPSGVPTVSDKDHARVLLNRAWSQGQFKAAVDMMTQEIDAALKSPEAVRDQQRKRFLEGQPGNAPAPNTQQVPAAATSAPAAPTAPTGVMKWERGPDGKPRLIQQ